MNNCSNPVQTQIFIRPKSMAKSVQTVLDVDNCLDPVQTWLLCFLMWLFRVSFPIPLLLHFSHENDFLSCVLLRCMNIQVCNGFRLNIVMIFSTNLVNFLSTFLVIFLVTDKVDKFLPNYVKFFGNHQIWWTILCFIFMFFAHLAQ